MKKLFERQRGNKYYKLYKLEEKNETINIIKELSKSGAIVDNISVNENVERDMQSITGYYSVKYFLEDPEKILSYSNEYNDFSIYVYCKRDSEDFKLLFYPNEKSTYLITKNKNLELTNMIK